MKLRKLGISFVVGYAMLAVGSIPNAEADEPPAPPPCEVTEVVYSLAANLKLSDTPMGAGNGVYPIGPGHVILRFERRNAQQQAKVQMTAYQMLERFTIQSTALFWSTTVLTDVTTTTTPDAHGSVATGTLADRMLGWNSDLAGYRTDGTITCSGSLCGSFGAPPPGKSQLHIAPHPVRFRAFEFAPDMKTFTMPSTFVSKTDSPKQTAHILLAGREVRRTCVTIKAPSS
jgi:hypothetical protein